MPQVPTPRKRRLPVTRHGARIKPLPDFSHNPYRWYVADYDHIWVGTNLYITVTSDVPCHLTMHWTDIPSRMHMRWDNDSGLLILWNPRFCFVEFELIEQAEPGDTMVHTFTLTDWSLMQSRWWVFIGTMFGDRSLSASCIFHAIMTRLDFYSLLDALGPYLHLTYPTFVDPIHAYTPVPLLHQKRSVGAQLSIYHEPWLFITAPIQALLSTPAVTPPASISASFTLDLWEPPHFLATIDADYDTEVV